MIGPLNSDLWQKLIENARGTPLLTTLPCVNTELRILVYKYLESVVLPIVTRVSQCQSIKAALEDKIEVGRHWKRRIHLVMSDLLRNIEGENYPQSLLDLERLLVVRANLNAFTLQKVTPLLQICDALGELYSKRLFPNTRTLIYQRILDITEKLLRAGADPNQQGYPSTPLVTILAQQPFSFQEVALMKALVSLYVTYGANVDLLPKNDLYALDKSPRQLAQEILSLYI